MTTPGQIAALPTPSLTPVQDLIAVDDQVREFVQTTAGSAATERLRLIQLERSVNHPGGLGVRYDVTATLTAQEAYRTRRGNCLSLSFLFAAMARSIGIEARFQEVEIEPYWTHENGVVFSQRHVNVIGDLRREHYVLDYYQAQPGEKLRPMRTLSDDEAFARFYNNIGAESLADGDLALAWANFQQAIELAPRVSFFWSNIAVLLNRTGDATRAEAALRYALWLDSDNTAALSNLVKLLERTERTDSADRYRKRIAAAYRRNPFYWFSEAERHAAAGRYPEALTQIERAIKLKPDEPVFYRLGMRISADAGATERRETYALRARRRGLTL